MIDPHDDAIFHRRRVSCVLHPKTASGKMMLLCKPVGEALGINDLYNSHDFWNTVTPQIAKEHAPTIIKVADELGLRLLSALLGTSYTDLCRAPSMTVQGMALLLDYAIAHDLVLKDAPPAPQVLVPSPAVAS